MQSAQTDRFHRLQAFSSAKFHRVESKQTALLGGSEKEIGEDHFSSVSKTEYRLTEPARALVNVIDHN